MVANIQVSAFTGALKTNFFLAWQETAAPAPIEAFTSILGSDTLIENYPNFTPAPAMTKFDGQRDYGLIGSYVYSIVNEIYSAAVQFALPDYEDDRTGALAMKPKELAMKAKLLKSREVMKCLASGQTGVFALDNTYYGPTFDTLNFFAARPSVSTGAGFGTGNNLLPAYNTAAYAGGTGDTNTYQICALYHGPETMSLRPMIWQQRSGPDFDTNYGDNQSKESLQVRCWATVRGKAAYGIWYNAIKQPINGKPNVAEIHDIFSNIEAAFRTFQLPKSRSTSFSEYVFEQTQFNSSTLTMCASTGLGEVLRAAVTQDWAALNIAQYNSGATPTGSTNTVASTNNYKGWANIVLSAFLN